ncbi:hypothetical protein FPV67DRAFT_1459725 [Lyophyllum atratum]|nr:hypothetical protein FPV67DRAFT_1459725 [Lyophyllum atratum]
MQVSVDSRLAVLDDQLIKRLRLLAHLLVALGLCIVNVLVEGGRVQWPGVDSEVKIAKKELEEAGYCVDGAACFASSRKMGEKRSVPLMCLTICSTIARSSVKNKCGSRVVPWDSRKGFAGAAIVVCSMEAHTNCTSVSHVRGARACPPGLNARHNVLNALPSPPCTNKATPAFTWGH